MLLQEGQERSCSLFWANLLHCKPSGDRVHPDSVVLRPGMVTAIRKYLCSYKERVRFLITEGER